MAGERGLMLRFAPTLLLGLLATACATPGPAGVASARLDQRVASELARAGLPGATLAVQREGRMLLQRAYGQADLQTGAPMQPDMRMRIASVSKPVTAIAVLRLVEQGRLDLDAPVLPLLIPRLPPEASPDPAFADLSARQLLAHCGGWDRGLDMDPMLQSRAMTRLLQRETPPTAADIVAWALSRPPDFVPGARCEYGNLGYAVLGRVLEAVTGQDYAAAVETLVLAPAGIAGMRLAATRPQDRQPDEPRYHDARRAPSAFPPHAPTWLPDGPIVLEAMDAHGGWLATAGDLVRLVAALEGQGGAPLLSPTTRRMMLAPVWPPDARGESYALGWDVDRRGRYWHGGDLPGTVALLVREPDGTVWALLVNGGLESAKQQDRLRRRIGAAVRRLP